MTKADKARRKKERQLEIPGGKKKQKTKSFIIRS